jgi:ankyrin repeat protein
MNRINKLVTISVSLLGVIVITMITHFALTQMPDEIKRTIDVPEQSIDVNAFDAYTGLTPLMQAAIDSDLERTKILLSQGADPNIISANSDRDNALNIAVFNGGKLGSLAVAQELIAAGADVNAKNARGMAPIHFMMQITNAGNRAIILRDLMNNGARINAQNEDGSTMLHIAVTNLDYDWIDLLNREFGQIINYTVKDKQGRTPLDLALERGLTGDISLGTQSVENSLRNRPRFIGDNFDVRQTDEYGRNGLQLAVLRDDMKFVSGLLSHNPDLAHQDDLGNSVMHYAVLNLNPTQFIPVLLNAKAPVNIANNRGETPIFWIMKIRNRTLRNQIAKLLLNAGSPVTNKNTSGTSIIDLAAADNDTDLVDLLKQAITKKRKRLDQEEAEEPSKKLIVPKL